MKESVQKKIEEHVHCTERQQQEQYIKSMEESVQKQFIYTLISPQINDVVMWQQEEELTEAETYGEVNQFCISIEAKIQVQLAIAGAVKM